jgi:hypothetical protein
LAKNIVPAPGKASTSRAPVKTASVSNNKQVPATPVSKPAANGGKPTAKPAVKPIVPPAAAKKPATTGKR